MQGTKLNFIICLTHLTNYGAGNVSTHPRYPDYGDVRIRSPTCSIRVVLIVDVYRPNRRPLTKPNNTVCQILSFSYRLPPYCPPYPVTPATGLLLFPDLTLHSLPRDTPLYLHLPGHVYYLQIPSHIYMH